jgi:hypothetical protein
MEGDVWLCVHARGGREGTRRDFIYSPAPEHDKQSCYDFLLLIDDYHNCIIMQLGCYVIGDPASTKTNCLLTAVSISLGNRFLREPDPVNLFS